MTMKTSSPALTCSGTELSAFMSLLKDKGFVIALGMKKGGKSNFSNSNDLPTLQFIPAGVSWREDPCFVLYFEQNSSASFENVMDVSRGNGDVKFGSASSKCT